jgi:serine/threonine protein kinase
MLHALNYLHKKNVVHRDLKLDNIMVDLEKSQNDDRKTKIVCKVTDFGFAKALEKDQKETLTLGTPHYMAPELVKRQAYDSKVDIWALGVLTYMILVGKEPFRGRTQAEIFQ